MYTDQLENSMGSTIIGGVVLLVELGSIPIAMVILLASVCVPVGKLIALFYLCWIVSQGRKGNDRHRTVLYRITEFIGKWSMVDVFVVAILVALVHLTGLLVIRPGPAALFFAALVIVTMIAAKGFDQRLVWDNEGQRDV